PMTAPRTRLMPAAAICLASTSIGSSSCQKRGVSDGSPEPRKYRFPFSVPSGPTVPSLSTGVRNVKSGPKRSSASADVYIFIVDAGCIMAPGFFEKSVSPRVSDTIMAPHSPPLVLPASADETASLSCATPFGDAHGLDAGALADAERVTEAIFEERVCADASARAERHTRPASVPTPKRLVGF